jgi:hypothetical protein
MTRRQEIISEKGGLDKRLMDLQGIRARLEDDMEWAATVWGSAIRETLPPRVRYLPEEPPAPAAPKNPVNVPPEPPHGAPANGSTPPQAPGNDGSSAVPGDGQKPPKPGDDKPGDDKAGDPDSPQKVERPGEKPGDRGKEAPK